MQKMLRRYLETNSTNGSQALAAGRAASLPSTYFSLGPISECGRRSRGIQIQAFGTDGDGETFDIHVWALHAALAADIRNVHARDVERRYIGKLACTLSTAVGSGESKAVTDSERLVDTMTWTLGTTSTTPKGVAETVEGVYGAATARVYSPADNTPAIAYIDELGGADAVELEFVLGTAASANALIAGLR